MRVRGAVVSSAVVFVPAVADWSSSFSDELDVMLPLAVVRVEPVLMVSVVPEVEKLEPLVVLFVVPDMVPLVVPVVRFVAFVSSIVPVIVPVVVPV